ncbi:MAG: hypothetical protein GBAus27B_000332 [Mycoplasmataceae bacterium]|nr:MAG: hypothetical protein GBAus27B_000332 [Mycoplasmataceae bacterium]
MTKRDKTEEIVRQNTSSSSNNENDYVKNWPKMVYVPRRWRL